MKKLVVLCISIPGLCLTVSAQSGRKVEPAASPTAAVVTKEIPQFSESTPRKTRPLYIPPSMRTDSRSKNKTTSATQTVPDAADGEVLKVETNLVTIPVSVFDRNGLYIPNLAQGDFKIFEDGEEQEIAYFGTSEKPFTIVLLLDTSLSTSYRIEDIQRASIAFVDQLKAQDNVLVIEFDGNINVLAELTNDRQKIYKAIGKADFGYGTSLYEAVDFSLRKRLSKIEGRKAIVLFTDGVDTTSTKAFYETTLAQAEESDSLIFPVYYNTFAENSAGSVYVRPSTRAEYAMGLEYITELAAFTGGRVFRPESTPGGLRAAFEGIAEELRRQYNIGYIPKDDGKPGQRKQIKVRVNRPNLVVRSRDSYIVGEDAATTISPATKTKK